MKFNTFCAILALLVTTSNLAAQVLKPIEIVNNRKFYYEDKRLQPNKNLQVVLAKARNTEVDGLFQQGKNISTLGKIAEGIGLGLLAIDLLKTIADAGNGEDRSYGLAIAGAGLMLGGIIIDGAGFRKKRAAVKKYNEVIGMSR